MSVKEPEEVVRLYQSDDRIMNDAIDRIVIKLHENKSQFEKSTILLTGCSPGNGTTMITINLAIALAGAGWNTLLVDADMRKGSRYKRLNGNAAGLSDYLEGITEIDDIICPTNQDKMHYVMCGSRNVSTVRLLCSDRMQRFIGSARKAFDFVVIDCPSLTVVPDATVLFPSVDCIALVLALDGATKKELSRARAELSKYEGKYAGIIVNRVEMHQYSRAFPRHDYFEEKRMRKAHARNLKNSGPTNGDRRHV